MNKKQFHLVASKVLRKDIQAAAAFDVIFNGLTHYEAERKYHCVPNTVPRSVATVRAHFEHCIDVAAAK